MNNEFIKLKKDLEGKYPSFKLYLDKLSKASSEEKDIILTYYYVVAEHTVKILDKIIKTLEIIAVDAKHKKVLDKEIKEIENTISLGIPGWLRFTRKTKKSKK